MTKPRQSSDRNWAASTNYHSLYEEQLQRMNSIGRHLESKRQVLAPHPAPEDLPATDAASAMGFVQELEELQELVMNKELLVQQLHSQLRDAIHSQELSRIEVFEKDARLQELQDTITELHQEISLKDSKAVIHLQEKHHLENQVKALSQVANKPSETSSTDTHSTLSKSNTLLKDELDRRDTDLREAQSELLTLQNTRDVLSSELDAQEQQVYRLQRELKERQEELEQRHVRIQQLHKDLKATSTQRDEAHRQLSECNLRLSQLEGENFALRVRQREQEAEIDKLREGSLYMPREEPAQTTWDLHHREELEDQLLKAECAEREHLTLIHRLREELQDTVFALSTKQEELQGAQSETASLRGRYSSCQREAMELQQRVLEQERKNAELQREHRGTLEGLHRAREQILNLEQSVQELQEEKVRLQEHSQQLEQETGALHAELETQSLALGEHNSMVESKLNQKEQQVDRLRREVQTMRRQLQNAEDKVQQLEITKGSLQEELSLRHAEKSSLTETTLRLERAIRDLNIETEDMEQKVQFQTRATDRLQAQLATCDSEQETAREKISLLQEERDSLMNKVHQLQKELCLDSLTRLQSSSISASGAPG
ncbi:PREDICTED: spindle pole body component 110-like [Nanorana parkeri]|uniref:spindle pole body component 110-like n=1 Tax=Nanorana parkeri TaxID=125878 RepID=UPI000854C176|nr:PREDICTED: spindle pole body component 110-like [Nanorana parkeri]